MACTALASGKGGVKHFRKVLARGGSEIFILVVVGGQHVILE